MDPIREKEGMQASEILKNRAFDLVKLRKLIFPAYSSPPQRIAHRGQRGAPDLGQSTRGHLLMPPDRFLLIRIESCGDFGPAAAIRGGY